MKRMMDSRLAEALVRLETNEDFKTVMLYLNQYHTGTQQQLRKVPPADVLDFRAAEAILNEIVGLPEAASKHLNRHK